MDLEEFKKLMDEHWIKQQQMLENGDYADYVREHAVSDCMEDLLRIRKNAIFLDMKESSDEDIPIGASKLGGYPDLPPSISVPELSGYTEKVRSIKIRELDGTFRTIDSHENHYDGCSMQLIAQINLSEFAAYDRDKKLPEKGMLYFFWSGETVFLDRMENVVFDGDNTQISKVIYYDGDLSELRRVKPKLPYGIGFSEPLDVCRITPKLNTYLYDKEKLWDIFSGESKENAQSLENEYEFWDECQGDRLLGYFNGSMNVDPGENLLFQYSYHSGSIWDIYWFIDNKDLAEWKFENSYMNWDMDQSCLCMVLEVCYGLHGGGKIPRSKGSRTRPEISQIRRVES